MRTQWLTYVMDYVFSFHLCPLQPGPLDSNTVLMGPMNSSWLYVFPYPYLKAFWLRSLNLSSWCIFLSWGTNLVAKFGLNQSFCTCWPGVGSMLGLRTRWLCSNSWIPEWVLLIYHRPLMSYGLCIIVDICRYGAIFIPRQSVSDHRNCGSYGELRVTNSNSLADQALIPWEEWCGAGLRGHWPPWKPFYRYS